MANITDLPRITDLPSFNKAHRNVNQSNVVRLFDVVFHKTHNASLELPPLVMLSMKHLNHRSCLALWIKRIRISIEST